MGWACVYCINHQLMSPANVKSIDVNALWRQISELMNEGFPVNTLEFAGGNPTESLPWPLEALSAAPDDLNLPIVWNSNLYASTKTIELLDGVVDVYLPDFRYGNDECAKRLSGVDNFWAAATETAEAMIKQNARVLSRILVLPNHFECCIKKVLEWLSQYKQKVLVSIMDQYIPEYKANAFKAINRRPNEKEISEVKRLANHYGLRDIENDYAGFWE